MSDCAIPILLTNSRPSRGLVSSPRVIISRCRHGWSHSLDWGGLLASFNLVAQDSNKVLCMYVCKVFINGRARVLFVTVHESLIITHRFLHSSEKLCSVCHKERQQAICSPRQSQTIRSTCEIKPNGATSLSSRHVKHWRLTEVHGRRPRRPSSHTRCSKFSLLKVFHCQQWSPGLLLVGLLRQQTRTKARCVVYLQKSVAATRPSTSATTSRRPTYLLDSRLRVCPTYIVPSAFGIPLPYL